MKIYDLIILGAGPAGITAAIYASRKKLDFLVITKDIGGQAAWSGDIENYTGYQFITGPELALKFSEHMSKFAIPVKMPEAARALSREGDLIKVVTDQGSYLAKTMVVATGKRPRPLAVPGEAEFKNHGVTYCAVCDGPLFRDKVVAVVGGGNSALDAALQLKKVCPKVYVLNITAELTADSVMVEAAQQSPNIVIVNHVKITRIYGDTFMRGLEYEQAGQKHDLSAEGLFIEIGLLPNNDFCDILPRNARGEIIVDCNNTTAVPGVFAAGDVTNVAEKQIIIACGEGSKACLTAASYLLHKKFS